MHWANIGGIGSVLLTACLPASSKAENIAPAREAEKHLVLLANDKAVVGVLPQVGGRVVLYRAANGPNVLLSDEKQWAQTPETAPQPSPRAGFVPYNGHIVWVGPESEWWTQQSVNDDRRKRKAGWPPDPYLEYGRYEVVARTPASLRMIGPESPVCGLKLVKEVRLLPDGSVVLRAEGTNIRDTAVSWDLWSNTRLPASAACYVPIREAGAGDRPAAANQPRNELREEAKSVRVEGALPWVVRDGFFHFLPSSLPEGKAELKAKAFIDPADGFLAAFHSGYCFLKRTAPLLREKIHREQAFIEVYLGFSRNSSETLLELEFHSEHRVLQPGEKMALEETWMILPYAGPEDAAGHVRFLTRLSQER
jgi:hypothetical protein